MPDPTPLEIAQQLADWGYAVLPAAPQGKTPLVKWKGRQRDTIDEHREVWFSQQRRNYNYWAPTGSAFELLVLDCDNAYTEAWFHERIAAELDATVAGITRKGHHYHFSLPPGQRVASWSVHQDELQFDVRADGTGVILPPSVHESGHVYAWERSPETYPRLAAPTILLERYGVTGGHGEATGGAPRSMLTHLLRHPADTGGRNEWLTTVAGHYASQYRGMQDAYELHVDAANALLADPLDDAERDKIKQSIWTKEHEKPDTSGLLDEANGYLVAGDRQLLCEVSHGKGQDKTEELVPWSNFDITALGVTTYGDTRTYDVEILRHDRTEAIRAVLPAAKLGDQRATNVWLAGYSSSFSAPAGETSPRMGYGHRLQRYLDAQDPPQLVGLAYLGQHDELGFVTHEGVITPQGLVPLVGYAPHPILRERAPYRYGFDGTIEEAQETLRQVLTYQEPTTASVIGAWWAACFLKADFMRLAAMFPFLALEAPSESGKTTGLVPLLVQLAGDTKGHGEATMAALRDYVASHRNGPTLIDDLSDPGPTLDLLRQATMEGVRAKKAQDRYSQEMVQLVSPVILAGEGLGALSTEKALQDRAIRLDLPTPVRRMSLIHPDRLQWDDIVELRARYGDDLTRIAGWMVMLALQQAPVLDSFASLRAASGRVGDKWAILRCGARILAGMTDDEAHIELVDGYVMGAPAPYEGDNSLTTEILPELLARSGWPTFPVPSTRDDRPPTPCFTDASDSVWFHVEWVALEWAYLHRNSTTRLHTRQAIEGQRRALQAKHRRWTLSGTNSLQKGMYWLLPPDLSREVLVRSGRAASPVDSESTTPLPMAVDPPVAPPSTPLLRRRTRRSAPPGHSPDSTPDT